MANFASIELTFTDASDIDGFFNFVFIDSFGSIPQLWQCKAARTTAYQYQQGPPSTPSAQQFLAFQAISADLANHPTLGSRTTVTQSGTEIIISMTEYGWQITNFGQINANVTAVEIPEVLPTKDFQLTGFSVSETALAPCANVDITITQNGDGVAPFTWVSPSKTSTTLTAVFNRSSTNQTIDVTIEDDEGDQATLQGVVVPRLFNASEINNISVVTNQGGLDASVTVFMNDDGTFTYSYSLDGSNFQSSNIFSNVVDGSYTLYVQDGLGCITTQAFDVDTAQSVTRANPYALVPKANSFRFIQETVSKYNTLENTLYEQEFYAGEYKPAYCQPYQTNDGIITTQFRSNYDELSARALDTNGVIIDTFTIEQKSNNLSAQDERDCILFNKGNNQTGVYFTIGNIYEFGTTNIIDTYQLNGQLPEWGVAGNTIVFTSGISGSYVIKQVVFDSDVQANVLVIDYTWTAGSQSISGISQVTYNRLPYETYEFDTDMGVLPEDVYRIQILMTDSLDEYPPLTWNAEYIHVKAEHRRTNFFEYSESEYTGIDYTTGYQGRVRLRSMDPYHALTPGGEAVNFKPPSSETIRLKDIAEMSGNVFIEGVPRYMVEKIRLMISHEIFLINGEQWTNSENMEVSNFTLFSLKNVNIPVVRNNYEQYGTDNIDINGDKDPILQETGELLQ